MHAYPTGQLSGSNENDGERIFYTVNYLDESYYKCGHSPPLLDT